MKTLLTLFVLLFSSSVVAEVYSCSHELSRWNRSGEVETKTYTRYGNTFEHNLGWTFNIIKENDDILILLKLNHYIESVSVTIINKKTKEFTENFTQINDAKEVPIDGQVYGKCIITY